MCRRDSCLFVCGVEKTLHSLDDTEMSELFLDVFHSLFAHFLNVSSFLLARFRRILGWSLLISGVYSPNLRVLCLFEWAQLFRHPAFLWHRLSFKTESLLFQQQSIDKLKYSFTFTAELIFLGGWRWYICHKNILKGVMHRTSITKFYLIMSSMLTSQMNWIQFKYLLPVFYRPTLDRWTTQILKK